jgi:membrane protein required for beta-lactamase induction
MKKTPILLLIALLGVLLCTACVTKKSRNLDRDRDAALDAARRMDNALGN